VLRQSWHYDTTVFITKYTPPIWKTQTVWAILRPPWDRAQALNLFGGCLVKISLIVVVLAAIATFVAVPFVNSQNAFTPDQVKFGPAPPFLQPGAQFAVIEGDPMASTGDFTIRLKLPDGYRIAPHTHPHRENVTVITGALKVGMGTQFETAKMASFGAGSFAYLDPSMPHYAMASGETVIQVHGMSPAKFNYINPADDPSGKK